MEDGGAARARNYAKPAALSVLGASLVVLAVFAVLNVDRLEVWGGNLADRFHGGLPLPLTLVFVFVTGILTSLTPCVYPVVPLAVTYLGARSASSRLRAFSLASAYVAGMVICYTILGAAAALSGTAFGTATQRWWVYGAVATVILLFGLSMFGLFSFQLPGWLTAIAGRKKGPGYRGAVLMGATSGLVTAPCTAPVLGTLIIPMISQRSVALGSLLLAVFGLGMGMLFLVVGTYSGVLASLPRSGRWMNAVKFALGAAILLVAGYYYYTAWQLLPGGSRTLSARPRTPEVLLAGIGSQRSPSAAPDAPSPSPAFELFDTRGRRHDLAEFRGKTLHLVFLAVWCPPCLDQLRRVELADARLRGRGYRVLGVALREREDEEALKALIDERQIEFPIAWDRTGGAAHVFGVDSIPAHVIVGPDGTIVYRGRNVPEGLERDGGGLLPP